MYVCVWWVVRWVQEAVQWGGPSGAPLVVSRAAPSPLQPGGSTGARTAPRACSSSEVTARIRSGSGAPPSPALCCTMCRAMASHSLRLSASSSCGRRVGMDGCSARHSACPHLSTGLCCAGEEGCSAETHTPPPSRQLSRPARAQRDPLPSPPPPPPTCGCRAMEAASSPSKLSASATASSYRPTCA